MFKRLFAILTFALLFFTLADASDAAFLFRNRTVVKTRVVAPAPVARVNVAVGNAGFVRGNFVHNDFAFHTGFGARVFVPSYGLGFRAFPGYVAPAFSSGFYGMSAGYSALPPLVDPCAGLPTVVPTPATLQTESFRFHSSFRAGY